MHFSHSLKYTGSLGNPAGHVWRIGEMQTNERLSYGLRQACEVTGLGRSKLYQEISEGRLLVFKVGSRTLIAADDLTAWLESYKCHASQRTPDKRLIPLDGHGR